ncbi:MAG: right-handed parallel beta-helix repeat-containing protein [Luminiphilus sp.]|jgi:parallel beta-helix repeat protein|nr:right-handed parallel beta-helix repeat-containing protein [Luminiphilus sp.]
MTPNTILRSALFPFWLTGCLLVLAPLSHAAIHEVRDGDSIQASVKAAAAGDTILVYPGTYRETVYVDKDDITLKGVVEEGEWPNLEGDKQLNDAILYSGNGFSVEWFKITNYKGNAIMGQAGNNFSIRNNWIIDTGVYGIFPEFGENGLIENNVLSGIEDAAIYVGMCDHIDVRNNRVFDNVAGIEIENSRHALVEGNIAHNNTGGILVFITPGLPIKTSYDAIIRRNTVIDNNTPNFAIPGSLVSTIPAGTGMIVLAGDDVIIEDNIISGNNTAGIIVTSQDFATDVAGDPDSDPNPDRVQIRDNVMYDNGNDPATDVKVLMLTQLSTTGPDIMAYKGAAEAERGSCVSRKGAYRTFGLGDWTDCDSPTVTAADAVGDKPTLAGTTRDISTKMLPEPATPRVITVDADGAKLVYQGICAGCHTYNIRMIGPPVMAIKAQYGSDATAIAEYIAAPEKKRPDFPTMPPQDHISEAMRLEVAKYMLALTK